MKRGIGETLEEASRIENHKERVEFLKTRDSLPLRLAIQMAFEAEWALPRDWKPDYKPSIFFDQHGHLMSQLKKMGKFMKGTALTEQKLKTLFVQLLESVEPLDAQFLVAAKNNKMAWRGLGRRVFDDAFPGLLVLKSPADADL